MQRRVVTIMPDSAALSWKREAISKTLPLLYLRIHREYDCETCGTAVSNVPTRADCRDTGKRLNEGIVASSDGGVRDECHVAR